MKKHIAGRAKQQTVKSMRNPWHVYQDGTINKLPGHYLLENCTVRTKREAKKISAPLIINEERRKARESLIAAAPILLESLLELHHELSVNGIEEDSLAGPSVKAIRKMLKKSANAIAKARGGA